jgi:stage II sporulation protein D
MNFIKIFSFSRLFEGFQRLLKGFLIFFASSRLRGGIVFLFFFLASPAFADSFQLKIGKLFAQGRVFEIEEAVSAQLEQTPGQEYLWLELAGLRKSRGDYVGAVAAYQNYLARAEDWKVRLSLGLILEQMGKFAEAEQSLLKLDKDHPNDPDILWGLARLRINQSKWTNPGFPAASPKRLKEAQKFLVRLTSLKPDFALAAWELAEVSEALGDRGRALKAYENAVRQDASFKWAHRHIAKLLAGEGRYTEALAKYEQAMAIQPDDLLLRKEAGEAASNAPRIAEKRKEERLRQWESWVPPEETVIAPSPVTIRVGVFPPLVHLLFRGSSDLQVMTPAQNPVTILSAKTDYQVYYLPAKSSPTHQELWAIEDMKGKVLVTFNQRIWIAPREAKSIILHAVPSNSGYFFAKEEDRAYRGILEIAPRGKSGFQVVNGVTLEDYLGGVLPSEMLSTWPMEALKAQAIVARTYVLSKMGRHNEEGFDVCDSVHCQVYRGLRAETERSNEAIRQTAGLVLKHWGKVMPVAFSAQCGGHTQDYEEAWGYKNAVVGVEDYDPKYNRDMEFPLSPLRMERWIREDRVAWCRTFGLRGYQNFRWAWMIPATDLEKKVGSLGRIRRLVVTHRSAAGWADRLLVEGESGSKEYKADSIRGFLGGIRSNLIWIEPQFSPKGWPEEFIVYGGGWGHGVGMCQVGTYGLAKGGKLCEEILKHYFPKSSLEKLDN